MKNHDISSCNSTIDAGVLVIYVLFESFEHHKLNSVFLHCIWGEIGNLCSRNLKILTHKKKIICMAGYQLGFRGKKCFCELTLQGTQFNVNVAKGPFRLKCFNLTGYMGVNDYVHYALKSSVDFFFLSFIFYCWCLCSHVCSHWVFQEEMVNELMP